MTVLQTVDGNLLRASTPPGEGKSRVVVSEGPGSVPLETRRITYEMIAEENPTCYAVLAKLVRQIATLPFRVYEGERHGEREEVSEDHPLRKLLDRPAPRCAPSDWKEWLVRPFYVHGNGLVGKYRGPEGDGLPTALLPAPWPYISAWSVFGGPVEWWTTTQMGTSRYFSVEDSIHMRWGSSNINGLGVSPLKSLAHTIRLDDSARTFQQSSFANGAQPGSMIVPPESFTYKPGQREELREEVKRRFGGSQGAFDVALLAPGFDWKSIAFSPRDAEIIAARNINREEIAMVYDLSGPMINDLTHGTYCLPASAMVSTDRGPVPIVDVRSGDRVWSMTGDGLALRIVSWAGQTGMKPLLTIRTQNRTLRCTDNHPVLVARHLDRRKPENRGGPGYRHEWVAAGELKLGDVIMTATSRPKVGVRSCPTRKRISVGFAEFCGLMLGDGSVDVKRGQVSVARGGSARYMDHYRQVMRREFSRSDSSRVGSLPVKLAERERDTNFVSRSAADELDELGLTGTAHTKRIPEWVHELAPDLRSAFLRGFIEADGSVDKKGHVSVHSANEVLLRQVRELCMGLGIPVTNFRAQRGWVLLPDGKRIYSVMWCFKCSDPAVNASLIGSHDPQDMERMRAGKPWSAKTYSYPRRFGGEPGGTEHCGHAKVVSIEQGDVSVPVYDLTVPETHNFIAEGVVVHNSNVEQLHRMLYVTTLRPPIRRLEETLDAQLIDAEEPWADEDLFIECDLSEVLRGNRREEIDAAAEAYTNGLFTLNQCCEMLGLPKVEHDLADEPFVAANNMTPMAHVAEKHEAAEATQRGALDQAGISPDQGALPQGTPTDQPLPNPGKQRQPRRVSPMPEGQ